MPLLPSDTSEDAIAAAPTEAEAALVTARAEGYAAAVDRIRAILTLPEARGREAVALIFALDTDMAPEVAAKALAASPVAAPARLLRLVGPV
jgi:hypothetical protein